MPLEPHHGGDEADGDGLAEEGPEHEGDGAEEGQRGAELGGPVAVERRPRRVATPAPPTAPASAARATPGEVPQVVHPTYAAAATPARRRPRRDRRRLAASPRGGLGLGLGAFPLAALAMVASPRDGESFTWSWTAKWSEVSSREAGRSGLLWARLQVMFEPSDQKYTVQIDG